MPALARPSFQPKQTKRPAAAAAAASHILRCFHIRYLIILLDRDMCDSPLPCHNLAHVSTAAVGAEDGEASVKRKALSLVAFFQGRALAVSSLLATTHTA